LPYLLHEQGEYLPTTFQKDFGGLTVPLRYFEIGKRDFLTDGYLCYPRKPGINFPSKGKTHADSTAAPLQFVFVYLCLVPFILSVQIFFGHYL
jgi:hypothetical protein